MTFGVALSVAGASAPTAMVVRGRSTPVYGKPEVAAKPNRIANCYTAETKRLSECCGHDALLLRFAPKSCTIPAHAQDSSELVAAV
jgi:hypothetical protein